MSSEDKHSSLSHFCLNRHVKSFIEQTQVSMYFSALRHSVQRQSAERNWVYKILLSVAHSSTYFNTKQLLSKLRLNYLIDHFQLLFC
jgi:homogentisate 1,2-dioxygenase